MLTGGVGITTSGGDPKAQLYVVPLYEQARGVDGVGAGVGEVGAGVGGVGAGAGVGGVGAGVGGVGAGGSKHVLLLVT